MSYRLHGSWGQLRSQKPLLHADGEADRETLADESVDSATRRSRDAANVPKATILAIIGTLANCCSEMRRRTPLFAHKGSGAAGSSSMAMIRTRHPSPGSRGGPSRRPWTNRTGALRAIRAWIRKSARAHPKRLSNQLRLKLARGSSTILCSREIPRLFVRRILTLFRKC